MLPITHHCPPGRPVPMKMSSTTGCERRLADIAANPGSPESKTSRCLGCPGPVPIDQSKEVTVATLPQLEKEATMKYDYQSRQWVADYRSAVAPARVAIGAHNQMQEMPATHPEPPQAAPAPLGGCDDSGPAEIAAPGASEAFSPPPRMCVVCGQAPATEDKRGISTGRCAPCMAVQARRSAQARARRNAQAARVLDAHVKAPAGLKPLVNRLRDHLEEVNLSLDDATHDGLAVETARLCASLEALAEMGGIPGWED